jgi:hypothetical protein
MRRRKFIMLVGGAAVAWPMAARAQRATRTPRIGVLAPGRSVGADATLATLSSIVTGLRELGYIEGQNIAIERGFGEANADRLRDVGWVAFAGNSRAKVKAHFERREYGRPQGARTPPLGPCLGRRPRPPSIT